MTDWLRGKRIDRHFQPDPLMTSLAQKIIHCAVTDWAFWKDIAEKPHDMSESRFAAWREAQLMGFQSPKDELRAFFQSVHFEELCALSGESICPRQIRAHLEIGDEKPQLIKMQTKMELISANWGAS